MKLLYNNRLTAGDVVFDAGMDDGTLISGWDASYPPQNVANDFFAKKYKTNDDADNYEYLLFDLGSAKSISAFAMMSEGIADADGYWADFAQIQGNATNSWGSPSFNYSAPINSGGFAIYTSSTPFGTYRYWRVVLTRGNTGSGYVNKIYLGDYVATTDEPDFDGYQEELQDNSVKQKSRGGQTFVDSRDQYLEFSVKFSSLSNTDSAALKTYADTVGESVTHFVQVQTSPPLDVVRFVKLKKAMGRKVSGFSAGSFMWDIKELEYETQL